MSRIDQLDKALPQTQCEECGFNGCKPYAEAVSSKEADINLCPPGGVEVVVSLASIMQKDPAPYLAKAERSKRSPAVAKIRESECIGCTKCIQACPVDSIIGSNKQMHTVFAQECTGCRLCVEPCPVDCIDIVETDKADFDKDTARQRFNARNFRLSKMLSAKREQYINKRKLANTGNDKQAKQDYIMAALKRKLGEHE